MMRYVGVDLSKRKFSAVILDDNGDVVVKNAFAMDPAGIIRFTSLLQLDDVIAFEAGSNCYHFHDLVVPYVKEVKIVNTYAFKVIKSSIKKTDMNDAYLLAKFLRYGELPIIYVPPVLYREMRELLNFREKLVQMRTKARNMITTSLEKEGILIARKQLDNPAHREKLLDSPVTSVTRLKVSTSLAHLEQLDSDILKVENHLKEMYRGDPVARSQVCRLMQIPGIGELMAIAITGELGGSIDRFTSKKAIAAYAGLVRKTDQSGDSLKYRRIRRGRKLLKKILTQIVLSQVGRYSNPIVDYYMYKKKEKCAGKAVVAASRKLITVIYVMLKYDKDFWFVEQNLYFKKLRQANISLAS